MKSPILLSIQVGLPKKCGVAGAADPTDRPWTSGIFKEPVPGPVWLGQHNLAGDGQADLENHGGSHKAVLGYSADHYPSWLQELAPLTLPYGAFGENFTIAGQTEATVCLGDTYAVAEAEIQVSQPRLPCWKLARKWRIKDLAALVLASNRGGWYYRVLHKGHVAPGLALNLLDRPFPQWSIARVLEIYSQGTNREAAAELAHCPLLTPGWRQNFQKIATGQGKRQP
ncbi:MAG: MOSC domain-containing protein [Deinococcus sp.]|nr:MOSC domain-containing protein [Deinococcus sp.]